MTDFEYQREYFKEKYKVVLPDLRGHGSSLEDNLSNFFEDSAKDIAETLNHLRVKSAHIVGCSLGALVGLIFAKIYPRNVKSLAISGVLPAKPENWLELHNEDVEHILNYYRAMKLQVILIVYISLIGDIYLRWLKMKIGIHLKKQRIWTELLLLFCIWWAREKKGALYYLSIKNDVHVSIIPFASHLVHIEQPEIYTKILEAFITDVNRR